MQTALKRSAGFLGIGLTFVCIGFVFWRLTALIPQLRQHIEWRYLLAGIASATAIYSIGCIGLALAWGILLRALGSRMVNLKAAAYGHLRAQTAKYLPGNFLHFAVRHASARKDGLAHDKLAYSAIAESMVLVIVASVLSSGISSKFLPTSIRWFIEWRWLLVAALVLVAVLGFNRLRAHRPEGVSLHHSTISSLVTLVAVGACYLWFFLAASLAFQTTQGAIALPFVEVVPIVAICWLGGFLVVGAPGGLGVREALFLGILGPLIGEVPALVSALTFRVATTLGDVVMSLIGMWLGKRSA